VSITAAGDHVDVTIERGPGDSESVPPTSLPTPAPGECWRIDVVVTGRGSPGGRYETFFVLRGDEAATCDRLRYPSATASS
jgi:hypothetical protein